ncbi:hypothetical protein DFH07DRAFT_776546 [Mycena maculata]|uniref:Uncharacterized protein n=1 Tax=Mycena maculata TaxID=230809 RepID=A0AAD7ILK6_9AGAR|nr:hypothetical protein DFH07DRAFT_776546 [Mycena maculata]
MSAPLMRKLNTNGIQLGHRASRVTGVCRDRRYCSFRCGNRAEQVLHKKCAGEKHNPFDGRHGATGTANSPINEIWSSGTTEQRKRKVNCVHVPPPASTPRAPHNLHVPRTHDTRKETRKAPRPASQTVLSHVRTSPGGADAPPASKEKKREKKREEKKKRKEATAGKRTHARIVHAPASTRLYRAVLTFAPHRARRSACGYSDARCADEAQVPCRVVSWAGSSPIEGSAHDRAAEKCDGDIMNRTKGRTSRHLFRPPLPLCPVPSESPPTVICGTTHLRPRRSKICLKPYPSAIKRRAGGAEIRGRRVEGARESVMGDVGWGAGNGRKEGGKRNGQRGRRGKREGMEMREEEWKLDGREGRIRGSESRRPRAASSPFGSTSFPEDRMDHEKKRRQRAPTADEKAVACGHGLARTIRSRSVAARPGHEGDAPDLREYVPDAGAVTRGGTRMLSCAEGSSVQASRGIPLPAFQIRAEQRGAA